jgi:hypothetical protein
MDFPFDLSDISLYLEFHPAKFVGSMLTGNAISFLFAPTDNAALQSMMGRLDLNSS